jgi:hypothetical protein
MFPLNTILAWNINIIMNKKYDNNNIIIASRTYFLQEPSSALKVIVWGNLVWGNANFEECFVALHMISVRYPSKNRLEYHSEEWYLYVQLCYLC